MLVDEVEEATLEDFRWRLLGASSLSSDLRLILLEVECSKGDADDEFRLESPNSEALVGGDDASGEDFCGELLFVLLELEEYVEVVVREF